MNHDQLQRSPSQTVRPAAGDDDAAASAARLAESRDAFAAIFAAADGILGTLRNADNQRFLEQVRQSGGQ